jgi:hypothetical protein
MAKKDRKKKMAERDKRHSRFVQKKNEQSRKVMSNCVDCGEPCYFDDEYMVSNEVWAAAGMIPRNGKEDTEGGKGRLHLACLEKRLGRKVTEDELLYWFLRREEDGDYKFRAVADIKERPEFLDWR